MIKVTLGDNEIVKKKVVFPKLMSGNGDWIVEVYENIKDNSYIAIHRNGEFAGQIAFGFNLTGFTDYNEPITIQNA